MAPSGRLLPNWAICLKMEWRWFPKAPLLIVARVLRRSPDSPFTSGFWMSWLVGSPYGFKRVVGSNRCFPNHHVHVCTNIEFSVFAIKIRHWTQFANEIYGDGLMHLWMEYQISDELTQLPMVRASALVGLSRSSSRHPLASSVVPNP